MNSGNLLPVQAEHLRVQRKKHGYTQPEISEILGCTVKTYRSWEKGKTIISSEFLVQLSGLFDVSCDYLLGRIEERDHDVKFVCEYTGLAGSAVEALHGYPVDEQHIVSELLSSLSFRLLLAKIDRLNVSIDELSSISEAVRIDPSDDNVQTFFNSLRTARIDAYEVNTEFPKTIESLTIAQRTIDKCMDIKLQLMQG